MFFVRDRRTQLCSRCAGEVEPRASRGDVEVEENAGQKR
jgi:hypothetical protein